MAMPNNRQFLEKIPLFADLGSIELQILGSLLKQREYRKDAIILKQDEPGEALFMIVKGRVKVVLYGEKGREIILSTLKERDFFGEMALLDGSPRSASVIAQVPSKILVLERRDFIEQTIKKPQIALKVLEEMSKRLREADEKIGTLALLDVYGRLARMLIHLAKQEGKKTEEGMLIEKRPTHHEIAATIGTSRETVSRALGDFSRRGMIQTTGKQILIFSRALMEMQDESSS